MAKTHYISVMGTLGCGKTTAAKLLANALDCQLIEENYQENAFLPRFYTEMPRWAFHSQTFFLMEKIRQMMDIEGLLYTGSVIQDTPIYQDVFSYAKAQHALGNMDTAEWELYTKIFHSFENYVPKPNLIVYLTASIPTIQSRVKNRGRTYEQEIPNDYLSLLDTLNHDWVTTSTAKIVTIETDALNLAKDVQAQEQFVTLVRSALS